MSYSATFHQQWWPMLENACAYAQNLCLAFFFDLFCYFLVGRSCQKQVRRTLQPKNSRKFIPKCWHLSATFFQSQFPPSPTILSHNPKEQGSPKRDDRSWTPNNRHATRNRDTNKIQLKTRSAHVPLCWLFFICIFLGVFGACFFRTLFYVHLRSPRHVTNSSVLAPWLKW